MTQPDDKCLEVNTFTCQLTVLEVFCLITDCRSQKPCFFCYDSQTASLIREQCIQIKLYGIMYSLFQNCNSWKDLYIAMVTSPYLPIVKDTMITSRTSGSSAIMWGHFMKKMFPTYKLYTCLTQSHTQKNRVCTMF